MEMSSVRSERRRERREHIPEKIKIKWGVGGVAGRDD